MPVVVCICTYVAIYKTHIRCVYTTLCIGHKGRTLVKVRQSSVEELEGMFNKTVILYLWIKTTKQQEDENKRLNI